MFDADVRFKLIVGLNLAMTVIPWLRTIFLMPVQKVDPNSPPFYTSPYYKWIRSKKQNSIQTGLQYGPTPVERFATSEKSVSNGQPKLYLWSLKFGLTFNKDEVFSKFLNQIFKS